jgi:c-di-GMP-binding flagellar brake protein YcgR
MNSPLLNYHEAIERASALHLSGPHGTNLTTVIWTIDSAQFRLNFSADADSPQLQALLEHEEATCVAYLDAVKLQFDADHLVLVRSAKSCALQCDLPREMYRFQRCSSFRVRTLGRGTPTALMRHPSLPDMQLGLRVLDVSIDGCALLLPSDVPPLAAGLDIRNVRIELPTRASMQTCGCTMSRRSKTSHVRRDLAVNSCTCSRRPNARCNATLIKHRSAGGFSLWIDRAGSANC